MKKNIYLILLAVVLISCEGDKLEKDYIIIDSHDPSMNVQFLQREISCPFNGSIGGPIDIENIGKIGFDISVIKDIRSSIVMNYLSSSIEVAVAEVYDTTFRCYYENQLGEETKVFYNTGVDYECSGVKEIKDATVMYYPLMLNEGDTLSNSLKWVKVGADPLYLSYWESNSWRPDIIQEDYFNHGLWEYGEMKYLCFRYFEGEQVKYFLIEMIVKGGDADFCSIYFKQAYY